MVSFLLLQYLPSLLVLLHCSLAFSLLCSSVVLALGIVVLDSWLGEPVHICFYYLVGFFFAVPHVRGPVAYSLFWIGPVSHALPSLVLTYLGRVSPCGYLLHGLVGS